VLRQLKTLFAAQPADAEKNVLGGAMSGERSSACAARVSPLAAQRASAAAAAAAASAAAVSARACTLAS
jgi:hypothetical protein